MLFDSIYLLFFLFVIIILRLGIIYIIFATTYTYFNFLCPHVHCFIFNFVIMCHHGGHFLLLLQCE
eukprot:UN01198